MSPLVCFKCNRPISEGGYAMLPDSSAYHSECFVCSHCGKQIGTKYASGDDGLYHSECFEIKFAKKCHICGLPVKLGEKSFILPGNLPVHTSCFACYACKKPLQGNFLEKEGKYYDAQCFAEHFSPRCVSCKKPMGLNEQYSEVNGLQFHKECLRCNSCKKSVAGGSFRLETDQKFTCSDCIAGEIRQRTLRLKEIDQNAFKKESPSAAEPKPLSQIRSPRSFQPPLSDIFSNNPTLDAKNSSEKSIELKDVKKDQIFDKDTTFESLNNIATKKLSKNHDVNDSNKQDSSYSVTSRSLNEKVNNPSARQHEVAKEEFVDRRQSDLKNNFISKFIAQKQASAASLTNLENSNHNSPILSRLPAHSISKSQTNSSVTPVVSKDIIRDNTKKSVNVPISTKSDENVSSKIQEVSSGAKQTDLNKPIQPPEKNIYETKRKRMSNSDTTKLLERLANQLKESGITPSSSDVKADILPTSLTKAENSIDKSPTAEVPAQNESPVNKEEITSIKPSSDREELQNNVQNSKDHPISNTKRAGRLSFSKQDENNVNSIRAKVIKVQRPSISSLRYEAPPPPPLPENSKITESVSIGTKQVGDSVSEPRNSLLAAIRSSSVDSLKKVDSSDIRDTSSPSFLRKDSSSSSLKNSMVNAMESMIAGGGLMGELKKSLSKSRMAHKLESDEENDSEW